MVASFTDTHLGMGHFTFVPQEGNTYTAQVTFENNETRTFPLPGVVNQGISLTFLRADTAQVQLAIVANEAFHRMHKDGVFYLIAQSNGMLCYAAQATLRNDAVLINLPKDRFPTGIAQFT